MQFTNSINYLLNQVATAYYANLENLLSKIGLHKGQIFVLIMLWNRDDQNQKELAENIGVSPPTVNKMVKSLERGGFIQTARCAADSRAVRVTLTEKGNGIRSEVERIWADLEADIYSNLTETEKIVLLQLLQKTKDNLLS